jgi:DUF3096 family protein
MDQLGRFGLTASRNKRRTGPPARITSTRRGPAMNLHLALSPLIALVAGILILVMPRLLNFIVAIYLIIVGVLGLFPQLASGLG